MNRHFLEQGKRKDLEQSVERGVEVETLLDDGDEDVDRDCNPDLRLHRVLRGAIESFDAQMLLDPLERVGDILPINITPPK